MAKYILKNLLMIIPTMLCVMFIIFTINYFTPGDPVAIFFDFDYTEEQYAEKAAEWGLDQPFFTQFFNYVKNVITKFDLGYSYASGRSVKTEIVERFPVSLKLGIMAVILTVIVGVPFGIISATRQYSVLDYSVTFVSLFFAAVPGFWLSMILIIVFSGALKLLPASGLKNWTSYIMPLIASSAPYIASITRQTRSSMLEVIRQDYIRTARAKGVSEGMILRKHALRNALLPVVTLIGMQAGACIVSAAVVESIHSFPGMGTLMLTAINGQDYSTIRAVVMLLSLLVCVINLIVDIAYTVVDPRVRAK